MEDLQKKIQLLLNLFKEKKTAEARQLNEELIKEYPKVVYLYNILGLILTDQKNIDEAIECYKKGIKIKPNFAPIYNNLGNIFHTKGDLEKAENYFKKSNNIDDKNPETENNLGNLYLSLNDNQKAISCYKKAINLNSKFYVSHYNIGIAFKNLGQFNKAKKHFNKSIKLNPLFFTSHRVLSQIIKYKKKDKHLETLKKLYKSQKKKLTNNAELSFALGKACEDIKDYINAFEHFQEGNALRRKSIKFSINKERVEFTNIKKIFSSEFFNRFKKIDNYDDTAIFIIGMPRSGTTLTEQILSNHAKVYGGDELNFLPNLIKKYFNNKSEYYLNNINETNNETLLKIGNDYISRLKKISNNSEKVTDKLPINFKWIGLIKIILPNSKIVHCVRNPRDNCLSIFKNYFTSNRMNFAYDLNEICEFYNLYYNLMDYWKNTLPNFIYDIKYENLINKPKDQIKQLLKSCNLSWNDNCLKFYNNKRPIKTNSDSQVRQKIYKTSVDSWRNYEKDLKSFFTKLKI